jgi:hypothetical protein
MPGVAKERLKAMMLMIEAARSLRHRNLREGKRRRANGPAMVARRKRIRLRQTRMGR